MPLSNVIGEYIKVKLAVKQIKIKVFNYIQKRCQYEHTYIQNRDAQTDFHSNEFESVSLFYFTLFGVTAVLQACLLQLLTYFHISELNGNYIKTFFFLFYQFVRGKKCPVQYSIE